MRENSTNSQECHSEKKKGTVAVYNKMPDSERNTDLTRHLQMSECQGCYQISYAYSVAMSCVLLTKYDKIAM